MRILIVYHSKTGNTKKMALAIAEGARSAGGIDVILKKIDETTNDDLLKADAIIVGSPTYFGQMSGKIKAMFDRSNEIHGKLEGKVGAAFTSSGGHESGAETTLISILEAMLIHGMVIQGQIQSAYYGVASVEAPKEKEEKECRELGAKIALLALKLKS